jgi:hypothetical protein
MSRMKTENGRKDTILHPPCDKLVTSAASHVAAYVMTPPAVANVGSRGGKFGLKFQGRPTNNSVAGEAYWIPLTAWPGEPGEDKPLSAIASTIEILEVVQHPGQDIVRDAVLTW